MKNFFRRSTATELWNFASPHVFRMISEMAAEKSKLARKLAR